jgi:hypothetical protein
VMGVNVGTRSLDGIPRGDTRRSAPARHQATGTETNAPSPGNGGGKNALPRNRARTSPRNDALPARTTATRNVGHAPGMNLPAPTGAEARRKHLHHAAARTREQRRTTRTATLHDAPEAQATTARNRADARGTNLPAPLRLEAKPERLPYAARHLRKKGSERDTRTSLAPKKSSSGKEEERHLPATTKDTTNTTEGRGGINANDARKAAEELAEELANHDKEVSIRILLLLGRYKGSLLLTDLTALVKETGTPTRRDRTMSILRDLRLRGLVRLLKAAPDDVRYNATWWSTRRVAPST